MIVPIGSVIEIQKRKFVVAGYSPFLKKGEVLPAYTAVPYPLGYLSMGETLVFPIDEVDAILEEGYEGKQEGKEQETLEKEKLLPVGSIVKIKEKKRLYMIAGFYPSSGEYVRQYAGVTYPNGMMKIQDICMFDGKDIGTVLWKGYLDEEGQVLLEALPEFLEEASGLTREVCDFIKRVEKEKKKPEESNEISIIME